MGQVTLPQTTLHSSHRRTWDRRVDRDRRIGWCWLGRACFDGGVSVGDGSGVTSIVGVSVGLGSNVGSGVTVTVGLGVAVGSSAALGPVTVK